MLNRTFQIPLSVRSMGFKCKFSVFIYSASAELRSSVRTGSRAPVRFGVGPIRFQSLLLSLLLLLLLLLLLTFLAKIV